MLNAVKDIDVLRFSLHQQRRRRRRVLSTPNELLQPYQVHDHHMSVRRAALFPPAFPASVRLRNAGWNVHSRLQHFRHIAGVRFSLLAAVKQNDNNTAPGISGDLRSPLRQHPAADRYAPRPADHGVSQTSASEQIIVEKGAAGRKCLNY